MVHLRVNNRESNPNPHINFITALPAASEDEQEDARQFLRALAAQVRPVMKSHGFMVNSLEEYEFNAVFAGRNWNNGETIELVLRSPSGSFQSTSWIMSTFCHELAHIKHMNHGPAFQALWSQLRAEVRQLQDKGYYGDGYWSSGKRLADSATVSGQGIESGVFPEFMCGGAHSRTRPTARRRRPRRPRDIVPSNSSGRQTAKRRKAGSRVTSKYAFTGEGSALDDSGSGGGYRKQAASKRAREARALAAEKRARMPQQGTTGSDNDAKKLADSEDASENGSDDDDDEIFIDETDADRRHALVESERGDLQSVKTGTSWLEFEKDFVFTGKGKTGVVDPAISATADDDACDMPVASGSTFTIGSSAQGRKEKPKNIGLGNLVQSEIDLRKKEALGMAPGPGHKLQSNPSMSIPSSVGWICRVCTLENEPEHLACSACAMPKGAKVWSQEG